MPMYVFKCPAPECEQEREELRRVSEIDEPGPGCPSHDLRMKRVPTTASFGFKTAGGNYAMFSGAHGPATTGSRKIPTIGKGHGLGGHRKFDKSKVGANPIPGVTK